MNFSSFLNATSKIKHLDLLGEASHAKMSPPYRVELAKLLEENRTKAKNAGVMALFYPNVEKQTQLVLILRKAYKGVHSAQIGFPGGKFERGDKDLLYTALRETKEEIGVEISKQNVVKALSPLYIPPSNFIVHPFLGLIEETPKFYKQEDEVEDILEVGLLDFLNEKNSVTTKVSTSYKMKVDVPAFNFNGHIVWGATAMMLSELKDLLKQVL